MSVASKEEVCTHRLVPRLGEPVVGVPIKKRPVSLSDSSAASSIAPSMQSISSAAEVPVSAGDFFNTAKRNTNVINQGKGIINSQIADHANRSVTIPMANSKGVLLNGSNEIPSCAEIDRSTAWLNESKKQKFSALDLQLASRRHGNNNYGSAVKEEKVDQCFSSFNSAQPHKNVQIACEINASSNTSFGKLPNLDLNVPPDPVDSDGCLPATCESNNVLYHGSIQHHNAQLPTISSGQGRNIDSLNLTNSYGSSHKCGPGDVTLDLQLKPPARPEIAKNWKGLSPVPELSLSLSGTPMAFSASNTLFNSEPTLSLKNVSVEAATVRSDKSTVEEAVAPVSGKANPQNTSPTATGQILSNNMVKKEPEEPSLQHIVDVEKTRLLEQQSVQLVNSCAEHEKVDSAPQLPDETQFDLNSNIFQNTSVNNEFGIVTDNVLVSGPSLPDTVSTEPMPIVPHKIQKSVKREESTSDIPSSAVATVSCHAAPMLMAAKSLSSGINVPNHATGSCDSYIQRATSLPASRLNGCEDMAQKPCDALQLQNSSHPIAEPLIHNSPGYAANDGMSQGSAEMDCSDDDNNTVFRIPTADRPQGGPSRNGPTTKNDINVGNLRKELKKELDNDLHQDCSSVVDKVSMGYVNDHGKSVRIRDSTVSHSGEEEHQKEAFIDETKGNQLLKMDKIFMLNNTDMHDVKTTSGSCSTNPQRSLALKNPASSKIGSIKQSPMTLKSCPLKTKSLDIKSETSLSPHDKLAASSNEGFAKNVDAKTDHGTEIEVVANRSGVRPGDSVMGESLGNDDASISSQPHSSCGGVKAASENSDEKSKPESYMSASVSNEKDGQLVGSHLRDMGYAHVNRNERWERFMESEREKAKAGFHDGRHGPDMVNQRRTEHRNGGRGTGSRGYIRNFQGPRMRNEIPYEDDLEHLHRIPHRRRHSPPAVCRRDMDIDGFPGREVPDPRLLARGQIEYLPDDMIQERYFRPHSHRHDSHGGHGYIHRERSHSPAQRRGAPLHFHRGRSPEAMHRSPPSLRTERTCLPHHRHTRRHGSPLDRIGHDERGMQRDMRMCGMIGSHRALEGDAFEPPFHPAHLAGPHAEEEFVDRRKYRDRRVHHRSLEEGPADDDEMLSYHLEEEMEFAECGGPQEHDGRLRNRMEHRMRREQEDSCRHRGHQGGWRDVDSNDNRPKRRRY